MIEALFFLAVGVVLSIFIRSMQRTHLAHKMIIEIFDRIDAYPIPDYIPGRSTSLHQKTDWLNEVPRLLTVINSKKPLKPECWLSPETYKALYTDQFAEETDRKGNKP